MATFAELVSDVYQITNRPDLVTETELAVRAATLKAHGSDFYFKDLFEVGISFDVADHTQQLEYRILIPRWRSLKYIRKYESGAAGKFIEIITPEQVLDSYGVTKEDVCYIAGEVIQIRSSTQLSDILVGCYIHPVTTKETFNSWVAAEYPFAIVYEAAATIFKLIGFDEQAALFKQLTAEQFTILRASNLVAEGY